MFNQYSRNWQLLVPCALIACLLGVISVAWPGVTLFVLTLLFGAYALGKGLWAIGSALTDTVALRPWRVPIQIRRPFDR
jgi:uncharacterized membrane protein HdeD (DUF308 family)